MGYGFAATKSIGGLAAGFPLRGGRHSECYWHRSCRSGSDRQYWRHVERQAAGRDRPRVDRRRRGDRRPDLDHGSAGRERSFCLLHRDELGATAAATVTATGGGATVKKNGDVILQGGSTTTVTQSVFDNGFQTDINSDPSTGTTYGDDNGQLQPLRGRITLPRILLPLAAGVTAIDDDQHCRRQPEHGRDPHPGPDQPGYQQCSRPPASSAS